MAPTVDKKVMAEKIAKVKEVVRGINQNDIVLALHSFDLDVEKTIQGLCEDRSAVLDEWECPGAAKKQKNKAAAKKKQAESAPASVPAPSVSSQKSEVLVPSVALTSKPRNPAPQTNGFHQFSPSNNNKENDAAGEAEWLAGHEKEAAQISASFNQECSRGREQIQAAFKALRQSLAEREKILLAALTRSQQEGEKLIDDGRKTAKDLLARARSGKTDTSLTSDLKAFANQRRAEQQLTSASAFHYDMTKLMHDLNSFGNVVEVSRSGAALSPVAAASPLPIRHAQSHSSIVSSEHDSGLGGHVSPVSIDEKKVAPAVKPMTQVNAGGIQVASDGLSAEQLEQMQKIIQAQLAASGIDASLVSGAGVQPARPRANRPRADSRKQNGGVGKRNEKTPSLSILG